MPTRIRQKDILEHKQPGDEWYSHQAPEELHVWSLRHPWTPEMFRDSNVSLLAVKVYGSKAGESFKEEYSQRKPLHLRCGVPVIRGSHKVRQDTLGRFQIRASGPVELEEALRELYQLTEIETWQIEGLTIYVPDKGAELEYKRFDPDGNGTFLYLFRVTNNDSSRLFSNVSLHEQRDLVGDFWDRLAHCTMEIPKDPEPVHACAIEKNIKRTQIKRRGK